MLETLTPAEFNESFYYSLLEPWGDDWARSSVITARLINSLREIAAGIGGEKLKESDCIEDDAFVPKIRKGQPKKKAKVSLAEGLAAMRQCIGV